MLTREPRTPSDVGAPDAVPEPVTPAMPRGSRRTASSRLAPMVTVALTAAVAAGCGMPAPVPSPSSATSTPAASGSAPTSAPAAQGPEGLRADGRRLVHEDGSSFVWVGDTAWNLTSLTREDVDRYLDKRREQGFTVIQTVAVFREPGKSADAYGHLPFDGSVSRLRITPGAATDRGEEYDYWDHVDYIVRGIRDRGMTAALLPAWSFNHAGKTVDAGNARAYGEFLAKRYGADGVVWVLGGDDKNPHLDIWSAMAGGIKAGATATLDEGVSVGGTGVGTRSRVSTPLITYHPGGEKKPSYAFTDTDFAMVQSGHCVRTGFTSLTADAAKEAAKPVIDSEPLYEDHPWCWKTDMGYARTDQVRKSMYWSAFTGGFGATYGNHSVWQFYVPGRTEAFASPRISWQQALDRPAAGQMRHLGALLRMRPDDQRVPDDGLLKDGVKKDWERRAAVRDGAGRWLMAYLPTGGSVQLDVGKVGGERVKVSWFDPRTGTVVDGGEKAKADAATLSAPASPAGKVTGEDSQDWVLIVDKA